MPMKVFVGYGFRDADAWVRTMVFPLIEAFGGDVVTGEEIFDGTISEEVRSRIQECDGLIGFLTRREELAPGKYSTHEWVVQEVAVALAHGLRVLEVREDGIDPQKGMAGDRQHLKYSAEKRDELLVRLVVALGQWARNLRVTPMLAPEEVTELLFLNHWRPDFQCRYTIMREGKELPPVPFKPVFERSGAYVYLRNVRDKDLVSIQVSVSGKVWQSKWTSINNVMIPLREIA